MSYFTTALNQICQQEGLDLPLHTSVRGNYERTISPKLEGFELLESKKPGQPDYILQAKLNGESIWYTSVNHKDYKIMNLYKPARNLVSAIKQKMGSNEVTAAEGKTKQDVDLKWTELYSFLSTKGVDSPLRYLNDLINRKYTAYTFNNSTYDTRYQMLCELAKIIDKEFNKTQANRFDKEIWAQVASGPRAEVIHRWNELITILRNQGDMRSTHTLNDLISKTFSVGAFNQADFEEKCRMLDQLKEIVLNKQEVHANRNGELMNRFSSDSWSNKKGPNQDIFAQSYEDMFYRDMNWEPDDEDEEQGLREFYKEKYGQYFPDTKIMSKILKDHGFEYSDYDSDAPNVKEHYNIDRFFDWLGY